MGKKKIIALGGGIIILIVAVCIVFTARMSGKDNAEKMCGKDIAADNIDNVNFAEAKQKVSYEKSSDTDNGTVNDKLEQMNMEFNEKYSKDTKYDEYMSDGFSEKYVDSMTEDMIRFEAYIFDGISGAEFKSIGITDEGEYILTYIYAQNDNEYVPAENETMPADGTLVEPDWNIGVLTYNVFRGTAEYSYYNGMYNKYFYSGDYRCRYLYDEQGKEYFVFGYKNSEDGSQATVQTGYSSEEIQRPQIMYNGQIYFYFATGFDEDLPEGFACVGSVKVVDNTNEPTENFQGARVKVGQEIYASETNSDIIYVKYKNGYARFSISQ